MQCRFPPLTILLLERHGAPAVRCRPDGCNQLQHCIRAQPGEAHRQRAVQLLPLVPEAVRGRIQLAALAHLLEHKAQRRVGAHVDLLTPPLADVHLRVRRKWSARALSERRAGGGDGSR